MGRIKVSILDKIICFIKGHKWKARMYINPDFKPEENDKILIRTKCKRCKKLKYKPK